MQKYFGKTGKSVKLDSVEVMREALAALFWFRVSLGLEYEIMFRRALKIYYPD